MAQPVYLKDIWPSEQEIQQAMLHAVDRRIVPAAVRQGLRRRRTLARAAGADRRDVRSGIEQSTYIRRPPFLENLSHGAASAVGHYRRAGVGRARRQHYDRSHFAGRIDQADSPAGKYLIEHGVEPKDFNSYGARRGNHEVMMRGTFANVRLKNQLVPGTEGGVTMYLPGDTVM